ncbi:MAG: SprT-like domain-containing protein, partial [Gelidibacter sp.]
KLFNDSDTFNLSITNDFLENANGNTSGASITISDSYLKNATQLSTARTMIHEMVHAYLNVKYGNAMSFENGIDFRLKMEKFTKDNGITNINSDKFHHDFMGQYVDAMAFSLLSWDLKYGTGGIKIKDSDGTHILDWEYYRSMAFGGLSFAKTNSSGKLILDSAGNKIYEDTNSFKILVPKEGDRDKIKSILINENDGKSKSKGTKC